jgi:acyl-CoA dehydrogenase
VKLNGCYVPSSALLGSLGAAYEAMALPFRDVEDAVGLFGLLGAFRFVLSRLTAGDDAALSLGGLVGLTAVFAEAASAVLVALDANNLASQAPTSIGLRVLAGEMLQRARAHRDAFGPADESALDRVFADLDTALSVARGPRQVRQARLGSAKAA